MEEIGRRLREARVAKGITLQEVEEETRIRKKYIEALESGRTVLIPGEVYVKGFLRTYGNFLGLDGEALVREYKEMKYRAASAQEDGSGTAEGRSVEAEETADNQDEPRPAQAPRPPAFVQAPRRSGRGRMKRKQRGPGPGVYLARRALVALIVILPLAGLGWWLWTWQAAAPAPPPSEPVAEQPGSETPPPATEPEPEPEPEPGPPPEPEKPVITVGAPRRTPEGTEVDITVTAPTIDLEMNFGAGTWLEVYTPAGERLYYGTAVGSVTFEGEAFRVRFGNVNSLALTVNGEAVDYGLDGGPYWFNFKTE